MRIASRYKILNGGAWSDPYAAFSFLFRLLLRDIHYIWLAGNEHPDFITINRFRNRVKEEINNVFTQLVLVLADKGFISLDVEYIDGTKIESKANKYTFVWRKTVERNRTILMDKIRILLDRND